MLPDLPELEKFYYDLPDDLIARYPVVPADNCRLLVMGREDGVITDTDFRSIDQYLKEGDLLVVNDSSVESRRVYLRREGSKRSEGARIEAVFLERDSRHRLSGGTENKGEFWHTLLKKRGRLRDGELLTSEVNKEISFRVVKYPDGRTWLYSSETITPEKFIEIGQLPIPPYLKREEEQIDRTAYQNPFQGVFGSVAAPTAGLHFTTNVLERLTTKGVDIERLTLHVGYGTFAPLKKENFTEKRLHEEWYTVPESLARKLQAKNYKRLIAVGTTTLRVLESVYRNSGGKYDSFLEGVTSIFVHPPDTIGSADGLITNFHLPGSSLLLLVSSFSSPEFTLNAYKHAVEQRYRFFSYGDAMLILNHG